MDFKDILKQERLAHQLTQEELGQLVGLKKQLFINMKMVCFLTLNGP